MAPALRARAAAGRPHTTEGSKASPHTKSGGGGGGSRGGGAGRSGGLNLRLRKSGSLLASSALDTALDTPSYRSPVKSPSQYFQICY